jgi:hypothetical protein
VSPDNPARHPNLRPYDNLNTRALEACGIDRDTPNPPGGIIDKDERGEPTGVLRDARGIVTPHIPPPTHEELRQGIRDAVALAHSLGCTGITDCSRPDESAPHIDQATSTRTGRTTRPARHVMTWYPGSGRRQRPAQPSRRDDALSGCPNRLMFERHQQPRDYHVGDQERNKRAGRAAQKM